MSEQRFVPTRRPMPVTGAHILGLRMTSAFEVAERIREGLDPTLVARRAR